MAELSGIPNWAIAGCMDWQKNGLPDATAIKNATKDYRFEMDILALWLDECAVVGKKYEVRFADAHDSFKPWGVTNYNCEYSGIKFGKLLTERGFEKTTRPHRGYKGLQLREGFGTSELRLYDQYKAFVKAICSIEFKPEESDE
jgi:putative DNA primase/helicase